MVAKVIKSLQHPLVKEYVKIREDRSFREKAEVALVPGEKLVMELSELFEVQILFFTKDPPKLNAKEKISCTPQIMAKITNLNSPPQVAASFKIPKEAKKLATSNLLILDGVQDPGNLGTLFRTALSFDFSGVIFTEETVDPFNDKAIRASKGAVFKLARKKMSREEIKTLPNLYLADMQGVTLNQFPSLQGASLILSHEGKGASPFFENHCTKISIPMSSKMESLNVASAGAILMYLMRRQ